MFCARGSPLDYIAFANVVLRSFNNPQPFGLAQFRLQMAWFILNGKKLPAVSRVYYYWNNERRKSATHYGFYNCNLLCVSHWKTKLL